MLDRRYLYGLFAVLAGCSTVEPYTPIPKEEFQYPPYPAYSDSLPIASAQADPLIVSAPESVPVIEPIEVPSASQTPNSEAHAHFQAGTRAKDQQQYRLMLDELIRAAELDHAEACYELARLLTDGTVVVKDMKSAKVYLERSAELGNAEALRVLGWNNLRGEYGQIDTQKGISLMRQAAQTSVRAQRELGMLYANLYSPKLDDTEQGKHYLELAAKADDAEAAYQLGRLEQAGGEVLTALEWYEAARHNGHAKASDAITALREGSEQGVVESLAASQAAGDADKLYQQANKILLRSQRTLAQEATAYAMLSVAADQGHTAAARELGFLKGVKTLRDREDPNWLEREKSKFVPAP